MKKKKRVRYIKVADSSELERLANKGRVSGIEERAVRDMNNENRQPEPTRINPKPIAFRQPCKRQSFTTREVAEKFVTDMNKQGLWKVVRCTECGTLHIDE